VTPGRGKKRLFIALCLGLTILFAGLGIWQVQRLFWKLDLIERVDARVHAAPAPLPTNLDALRPQDIEYRRVRVSGRLQNDRQTFVDALTELGPGDWVVTPLQTSQGTVLINRGFVAKGMREKVSSPAGVVNITGLLRLSEPGGRFLRANRPAQDLWYSRDVAAIARKRGLGSTAPVFIDADATPNLGGYPVGGLTVVKFRNAHLVYALTWFGLAALCVAGLVLLLKPAQKRG
jgi:surfeit locus 1 family protein